jgi:hypothetical protein
MRRAYPFVSAHIHRDTTTSDAVVVSGSNDGRKMNAGHSEKLHGIEGSKGHFGLTDRASCGILMIMEDGPVADEKATPFAALQHAQMGNQITQ